MDPVRHLRLANPHQVGHDINYYFRDKHDHDFFEVTMVVEGSATHCVNEGVQIIHPRSMLVIRPEDTHYFQPYARNKTKFEFYNIHITVDMMREQMEQSKKLKGRVLDGELPAMLNLTHNDFAYIQNKLADLNSMKFGEDRTYLYESVVRDMLWALLSASDEQIDNRMPTWFNEFLTKLSKQEVFSKDFAQIVSEANVSKSYLWKCFKKHLGMTPTDYINSIRLEYTYEKIKERDSHIGDIASAAGFNSYGYFVKLFSEKYGMKPMDLKKKSGEI